MSIWNNRKCILQFLILLLALHSKSAVQSNDRFLYDNTVWKLLNCRSKFLRLVLDTDKAQLFPNETNTLLLANIIPKRCCCLRGGSSLRQNPFGDGRQRVDRYQSDPRGSARELFAPLTAHPIALRVAKGLAYQSFERFQATVKTLCYLIAGAIRDPSDPAFRRVRASNVALQERFGEAGFKLLEDCGYGRYIDDGEIFYVLERADEGVLREIESVLNKAMTYGQQWLRMQLDPYPYNSELRPLDHFVDFRGYGDLLGHRAQNLKESERTGVGTSVDIDDTIDSTYSGLIRDCRNKYSSILVGPHLQDVVTFFCNVLRMKVLHQRVGLSSTGLDAWTMGSRYMLGFEDGESCVELVEGASHLARREASDEKTMESTSDSDEVGILNDDVFGHLMNQGYQREPDGSVRLKGPGNLLIRVAPNKLARGLSSNQSQADKKHAIMNIFYIRDSKASLRFWRNLLGLRIQRGSLFGDSGSIFIFANDGDFYPSMVMRKSKEQASKRIPFNRHQYTLVCPGAQIQLLSLLAAREGQTILQPYTSEGSAIEGEQCLILLSPDGNRVRFIPSESYRNPRTIPSIPDLLSSATSAAAPDVRHEQQQPLGAAPPSLGFSIKSQLMTMTRLLARVNVDEGGRTSSDLSLDSCRDLLTQACAILDSLFVRLTNTRFSNLDDFNDSMSSDRLIVQKYADCIPDIEQLRNESKLLLSTIIETKRNIHQRGKARTELQDSLGGAREKVNRVRMELQSADENALKCILSASEAQEEWSLATEAMQVCTILVISRFARNVSIAHRG
jgi:catechol 2,3-dioxygenase-like lactoylglutathione lyase family enzyme